jgi:hypothetical protein
VTRNNRIRQLSEFEFQAAASCTKEASAKSCLFKEWSNAEQENAKRPAADAKSQFVLCCMTRHVCLQGSV